VYAHLRATAANDIDVAVAYHRDVAGPQVALSFVDAFESAITYLCQHLLTGSRGGGDA
jgi:plasmid stabilization system protein ParE